MANARLIDQDERTRKLPMQVLVLGMCRTGTTSISVALRNLKYTPYQMREALLKPQDLALWQEAINVTLLPPQERSFGQESQSPYGKAEFDKLLGDYDALLDIPGCVFAKELIEAYPEAKVILTKRAYTVWEQSMQESIWCLETWSLFRICRILNVTKLAGLMNLVHSVFHVHSGNQYGGPGSQSAYEKHYDTVRSLVPKDRLLELDTDSNLTWGPLCDFLGKEVPKEQYPNLNEERAMRKNLENAWSDMVRYLILMFLLPGAITVIGILLWVYADAIRGLRDEWIIKPLGAYLDG